jgi:F-type H+-transporting ATPase subunit b
MLTRTIMRIALLALLAGVPAARAYAAAEPVEAGQGAPAHNGHQAKPQLMPDPHDAQTWYSALWVVIIFLVLLGILYPTAWKNVLAGLKAREARIRKDIADAEAARAKAEATLAEYNQRLATAESQVREMINSAVAQGEKAAADIRMRAQTEAEESKSRAVRDIEEARKQALSDIYAQAAEISTRIAEKIIRRELRAEDQQELVRRSLDELQTVGR